MFYRDSGVDIDKADQLVRFLSENNPFIGGFAGGVPAGFLKKYQEPVLFAATDGIGTKILLGQRTGLLDGLGYDLVGMCVNDLVTVNARPVLFLDYYATGRLELDTAKRVLSSVIKALKEIDCPLVGGETAELAGLVNGFDVAGFVVGVAERSKVPKASDLAPGMRLLGLRSSGPHSNGYSLIRKAFEGKEISDALATALMAQTKLYVSETLRAFELGATAAAHITGGGIPGNLIRVLPEGVQAKVRLPGVPEVFQEIQKAGQVPEHEMIRVFNMGWGMILVFPEDKAEIAIRELGAVDIGYLEAGPKAVQVEITEQ